jgi:hypothetical protein
MKQSDAIRFEILHMCKCDDCLNAKLDKFKEAVEKESK